MTKTGYTSVHSTLRSMQNVTGSVSEIPPTQGHLSTVLFSCCQITARIIIQHRLERQETPQDPVPAETVSCSWTRDPTKTVWHCVPEVELCPGALLQIGMQALPLWARISLTSWCIPITIANAMQFAMRRAKQTDMSISYR